MANAGTSILLEVSGCKVVEAPGIGLKLDEPANMFSVVDEVVLLLWVHGLFTSDLSMVEDHSYSSS